MIRILFDEYSAAHDDIFLKVDATPSFLQVADTYLLAAFLGGHYESRDEVALCYLNYFRKEVLAFDSGEAFIVFDLSDQYIGGVFISNGKQGLIKVEYCWSKEIEGWGASQESIEKRVIENRKSFLCERDWLFSTESILKGIDWSIKRLLQTKSRL